MSGINTGKVITGGLVAGLIYAVVDFITSTSLMAADFAANATRLGLDPTALESTPITATIVIIDFVYGILTVFIYAAMRPRFGPGPKTAVIAGVIPWLSVTLILFIVTQTGIFTNAIFAKMCVIQLISSVLGALAGAKLYKEA